MDDNDRQECGCPMEYHLADCDGTPAHTHTKEYWLNQMAHNDIDGVDYYDGFDE
jgi:hypothetical protein